MRRLLSVITVLIMTILAANAQAAETALTSDNYEHTAPVWSPDGQWIAYEKVDATGYSQIYKIATTGGSEIPLTTSPDTHRVPQWSPDSSTIVFFHGGPSTTPGIFTISVGGGPETQLTNNLTDLYPIFSPDGAKIAFNRRVGIYNQIMIVSSGGGSVTQLTLDSEQHGLHDWSPYGNTILINKIDGSGFNQLYSIPSIGGIETALTFESSNVSNGAKYSNNGNKIAYLLGGQIFDINVDGSSRRQITNGSIGYNGGIKWSNDDLYIASYSSNPTPFFQIYTIRVADALESIQTSDNFNHYAPIWSPDQSKIVYHKDDSTGFNQIYILSPVYPPPITPTISVGGLMFLFAAMALILFLTIRRRGAWATEVSG